MTNKFDLIDVSGILLEVEWFGSYHGEDGRVLVFLHEGLGCVELWRNFPHALSERLGLRSFIYSRQGYGKSDPISLPRTPTFMHVEALEVLPEVLDRAGIDRAILIGHSDGASISLINAGGSQDPRVEAVVVLAAHVFNECITVSSIEAARLAFQTTKLRDKLAKYHGTNVDCAFWGWNDVWLNPEFKAWNIENYLPSIKVPVLAIQGKDDQYGTSAQLDAIKTGIGNNVTAKLISGCGHSPHLEQKQITLDLIASFVGKLEDS